MNESFGSSFSCYCQAPRPTILALLRRTFCPPSLNLSALQLLKPKPIRVRGCPVADVGSNANIWIIRDHDKYKKYTAKQLGKLYGGFYTDSRTTNVDKSDPFNAPVFKNVTKAGEIDFKKNAMERDINKIIDDKDEY